MVRSFSVTHSERMRGNRCELLQRKSWPEGGKQFFHKRGVKQWEKLPGEVMASVCREIFKTQLESFSESVVFFNVLPIAECCEIQEH